ncbi:nucleotidyltransferase domain-containing protein [Actinosynnema sp. NPDC023587]|uniref:nucleotidyltransferase domain-containing protein n=1 Tax=Actinosynnema sp. NPDC023587 TaxID=3154695 RepID=UPI00340A7FAF
MLVLSVVIGSQVHGLATPLSDVDRRGVFVVPTRDFWRFEKPPTSRGGARPEELDREVEHFCALALKANPSVLEVLVSPRVEVRTGIGAELRVLLPAFLSQRAAESYRRATAAHLARIQSRREATGGTKWKQVMHVVRLLLVCRDLVRSGELSIDMTPYRARLPAVRSGEVGWSEALAWADDLRASIASARSPLPAEPDRRAVEEWLVSVRERGLAA